jgi:hypothetical protein
MSEPCLKDGIGELRDRVIRQEALVQANDRADRLKQEVQHFPLCLVEQR